MFNEIENAQILVRNRNGCKVLPLFLLEDTNKVYAKNGNYYISILSNNVCSVTNLTWVKLKGIDEKYENNHLVYNS